MGDRESRRGLTSLHMSGMAAAVSRAIEDNDLEVLQGLVTQDPSVLHNLMDIGWSPLRYAADMNRLEIVAYLIEQGVDLNAVHNGRLTALDMAIVYGNLDMVKLLVQHGAKLNGLGWILRMSDLSALTFLLRHPKMDVNAVIIKIHGSTALHIATQGVNDQVVRVLLEMGADPTIQNVNGWTALDLTKTWNQDGRRPSPRALVVISLLEVRR